jgi:hypothetical protein
MSRDNLSTPNRGETWYEGRTIDTNNLLGVEVEGSTKIFEDITWGDRGVKGYRTGIRGVVCRLVRNMSGTTLLPKRLVVLDPTNPNRVKGYADTTALECYPVDEFLPAGGVANGDLFWIVIKGPAVCLTPMNGGVFGNTSINAGDSLCSLTTSIASTQTGTTAEIGRVATFVVVAATTIAQFTSLINFGLNNFGRAMSAKTSGQTNADILVDINRDKGGYP